MLGASSLQTVKAFNPSQADLCDEASPGLHKQTLTLGWGKGGSWRGIGVLDITNPELFFFFPEDHVVWETGDLDSNPKLYGFSFFFFFFFS